MDYTIAVRRLDMRWERVYHIAVSDQSFNALVGRIGSIFCAYSTPRMSSEVSSLMGNPYGPSRDLHHQVIQ